jgi:hypothetical protein
MKLRLSNQRNEAMTLTEVLVVIVISTFLVVVFILPALQRRPGGAQRINCVNNLKEINLAGRIWGGDNNDKYPTQVSVTNGGAMELIATGNVVAGFQVMSNELSTPKILKCPEDKKHFEATNFESGFSAKNISYFIGVDADQNFPQRILTGDDNFEINQVSVKSGPLNFSPNSTIAWDSSRHRNTNAHFWTSTPQIFFGYISLCDGSVQELNSDNLQKTFNQTGLATNRLAIP